MNAVIGMRCYLCIWASVVEIYSKAGRIHEILFCFSSRTTYEIRQGSQWNMNSVLTYLSSGSAKPRSCPGTWSSLNAFFLVEVQLCLQIHPSTCLQYGGVSRGIGLPPPVGFHLSTLYTLLNKTLRFSTRTAIYHHDCYQIIKSTPIVQLQSLMLHPCFSCTTTIAIKPGDQLWQTSDILGSCEEQLAIQIPSATNVDRPYCRCIYQIWIRNLPLSQLVLKTYTCFPFLYQLT